MTKQLGQILVDARMISRTTLDRALEKQAVSGKKLGEILEEMNVIWVEDVVAALEVQQGIKPSMPPKLGDILLDAEIVNLATLERALQNSRKAGNLWVKSWSTWEV